MRYGAMLLACTMLATSCTVKTAGDDQQPAATSASGVGKIDGAFLTTGGDGSDWAATGYNYQEQRFSPLSLINASNVGNLGLAWSADLPDARGQEATPIVIDGKLFVKERVELARTKGTFWQDYKFTNPVTKKIEPKAMYCEKLDDAVVCGGVYK